jgi:hypothetical protein
VKFIVASVLVFVAALGAVPTMAADEPQPLVVLVERNPWLMIIGSDSPTFALYADGLVIFRKPDSAEYLSVRLDETKRRDLVTQIAAEAIAGLRESYSASEWTDQPTNELHVWATGAHKTVSVYGALRREATARAKSPESFLHAFDVITKFGPEASPWMPSQIEVLIWPYEHSPEEPLPWPDVWPSFEHAQPRGADGLHQIFLPAKEFGRLQTLLGDLKPKQAVQFNNRKWAVSYRLGLPREDAWAR